MIGVLDRSALTRLGRDVQDSSFAISFAERYRGLLAQRVARIVTALQQDDHVASMDAVLSLKVSSATVGAHELSDLAFEIEQHLRRRDSVTARARALDGVEGLAVVADRAALALNDYIAAYAAR